MAGKSKYGDLSGRQFGNWLIQHQDISAKRNRRWFCRCICGTERSVAQLGLLRGTSTSCGCVKNIAASKRLSAQNRTHGLSSTSEYKIWKDIIKRCENPNFHQFKDYGGRGISVSPVWRNNFPLFLSYVGLRPSPEMTLDRIDNNGNYEPGNVHWATRVAQARNFRRNRLLTIDGVTLSLVEWAEIAKVPYARIKSRLNYGWEDKEAVFFPKQKHRRL